MRRLFFFSCMLLILLSLFSFVFVSADFVNAEIDRRNSKTVATLSAADEVLCSSSPCEIGDIEIYYYHTEHLAYDHYSGCGDNFVCWTPIYDLAVSCLDFYDVYDFMIGFDAKPGFTFGNLDIYIDDMDEYFDTSDWEWYRYEDDVLFFSYLPVDEASYDWDFYLTDYAAVDNYKFFPPEEYFPNPDISCYFDCYYLYEDPFCYCENSQKYECDAYGDLYSYYIDFETENGYWAIKNVYLYPLHDSDLYETYLIKFPNISQVEIANLVFNITGSNPDALYEQGNFYIEVYDSQDNSSGTIIDGLITDPVIKKIDIKQFLREDGIKFVFGNDVASRYIVKNIRIEFAARCSDGTLYDSCSTNKPKYCKSGELIENCSTCGCVQSYSCRNDGICIVFQGDVNGNCVVDIFDLATVGLAYGSKEGDSNWNENADLNNDDKIDIFDLVTVGLNYGKSC